MGSFLDPGLCDDVCDGEDGGSSCPASCLASSFAGLRKDRESARADDASDGCIAFRASIEDIGANT